MIPKPLLRLTISLLFTSLAAAAQTVDWPAYNGGLNGDHYSALKQINRGNVHRLVQAWRFDTGEAGQIQTNPMILGRTLYAYTPTAKVIALDATTGRLKWKFDSGINGTQPARGFAYYAGDGRGRLFAGIMNYLYCLDAETGKPVLPLVMAGASICARGWAVLMRRNRLRSPRRA